MDVAKVVNDKLKSDGQTIKDFSVKLGMSYSTLHKKITNNTFTAQELLMICTQLGLTLEDFKERPEGELIDLKKYPESSRPDVNEFTFPEYVNAGVLLEKELTNGMHIYVPYGVAELLVREKHALNILRESVNVNKGILDEMDQSEKRAFLEEYLYKVEKELKIIEAVYEAMEE